MFSRHIIPSRGVAIMSPGSRKINKGMPFCVEYTEHNVPITMGLASSNNECILLLDVSESRPVDVPDFSAPLLFERHQQLLSQARNPSALNHPLKDAFVRH